MENLSFLQKSEKIWQYDVVVYLLGNYSVLINQFQINPCSRSRESVDANTWLTEKGKKCCLENKERVEISSIF